MDPITLRSSLRPDRVRRRDDDDFWKSSYSYFNYEIRDLPSASSIGRAHHYAVAVHASGLYRRSWIVVKGAVDTLGEDVIEDGDVIANERSRHPGQHSTTSSFLPRSSGKASLRYACVRAHLHDVGGSTIGSGSPSTTEIFQEGLADSRGPHLPEGQAESGCFELIERTRVAGNGHGRPQRADGRLPLGIGAFRTSLAL